MRWFAKPVKESNPFGGSNPPPSAIASLKLGYGVTKSAKDERKRAVIIVCIMFIVKNAKTAIILAAPMI